MMHNHPSGDPKPSRDDVEKTPRDPKGRRSARHLDRRPSVELQQVVPGQADSLVIVAPQAPWNDVTVKLVGCVAGTSPEAEREPRSCQATPQGQQGRMVARTPRRH